MGQDVVRSLAIEQRKRLVASILEDLEGREWYRSLPVHERKGVRAKVLDATGRYHDFMLDVIKVRGESQEQSDEGLRLLRQIHANTRVPSRG